MVKPNVRRVGIVGCLVMCWSYVLEAQSNPLEIKLRAVSNTTVEITETNKSAHDINFPCGKPNMKVYVVKSDGTPAEDTDEGLRYKAAEHGEYSNKQSVCVSGSLKPGQSVKYPIDVSRLYKLNDNYKFTVRVEHNVEGIPTAKSDTVTLAIK
jgi:hypothetical protein